MGYLFLFLAIVLELLGTTFLKYSEGFSRLLPTLGCIVAYVACFFFLSRSLHYISLSIAYATWCGLGIVAATLLSVCIFRESISALGLLGLGLVIVGVVLMNLYGTSH